MNCYELLVKGLRQMDIPYSGKNGLFGKLTRMAVDQGMAPNAFLNGEGIVKAAGSLVSWNHFSTTDKSSRFPPRNGVIRVLCHNRITSGPLSTPAGWTTP